MIDPFRNYGKVLSHYRDVAQESQDYILVAGDQCSVSARLYFPVSWLNQQLDVFVGHSWDDTLHVLDVLKVIVNQNKYLALRRLHQIFLEESSIVVLVYVDPLVVEG